MRLLASPWPSGQANHVHLRATGLTEVRLLLATQLSTA